jgi:hypothetical protein
MRFLLVLCALLLAAGAFAQPYTITGKVTDQNGAPVPFATVTETGTRNAVTCDGNGAFTIRVSKRKARLTFTSTGFIAHTMTLTGATAFVALSRSGQELNEVVVTALGVRRKSNVTGYSTSALEGRVAGVEIAGNGREDGSDEGGEDKRLRTWQRSGLQENSVQLSVGDNDTLPLHSAQVAVQVDGFHARVLFDYYFENNKNRRLRGTFKLKLPAGASPCYFAFGGVTYMNQDKRGSAPALVSYPFGQVLDLQKDSIRRPRTALKEARVAPKEKAAYAFNEVVRGNVDPALAEWAGADVFSCAVFPLDGGRMHHIAIAYDINLLQSGGEALLELPVPYPDAQRQVDISILGEPAAQASVKPELPSASTGNGLRYHSTRFTESALSIAMPLPVTVLLQDAGAEPYFALSHLPTLPEKTVSGNAQAIFMLDVSWSSQPDKFNIWLKTVEAILRENRRSIREFAMLCFHVDGFWWQQKFTDNNERNLRDFRRFADKLGLVGATDLGGALKEAANPAWLPASATPRTIFLLSDGDASWGEQNLYQLSGKLRAQDRLYAFTTGFSGTDTRILDHLGRESGGAVFSILNEDEVQQAARAIRYEPWRIKSIRAKGGQDLLLAGRPSNLFPGQRLLLTGRGSIAADGGAEILLEQGGKELRLDISAGLALRSALARRIYGQVAVQQLETFSLRTEQATLKYASYFDVPGENNSFVMLENENLYRRFGIDSVGVKSYVDTGYASLAIARVLQAEADGKSLGSARADLLAWVDRLQAGGPVSMNVDTALRRFLESLPESALRIEMAALHGRNLRRAAWMPGTREELAQGQLKYTSFLGRVLEEKERSGVADAFTLVSTMAESNREDLVMLRDVAFLLDEWKLQDRSYQLLWQLLRSRPAEPATWALLAASLRRMQKTELAMVFYDLAFHTKWDARFEGFDLILGLDYYKTLRDAAATSKDESTTVFIQARLRELGDFLKLKGIKTAEADLMVVITWNTDNTDVDLHLREPSGEECYYSHRSTAAGGFLSNDARQGFGPEMYFIPKAPAGKYHVDLDFYRSSTVSTSARTRILVHAYKNWGRPNEEHLQKVVELNSDKRSWERKEGDEDETQKRKDDVLVIEF